MKKRGRNHGSYRVIKKLLNFMYDKTPQKYKNNWRKMHGIPKRRRGYDVFVQE